MMDNPQLLQNALILAVLALPLLVAALLATVGRSSADVARRLALNGALLHLGLTAIFCASFYPALAYDRPGFPEFRPLGVPGGPHGGDTYATGWDLLTFPVSGVEHVQGMAPPRDATVQFYVGVDGLNLWLVALASVMTLVAVLASWRTIRERVHTYFAWVFVLLTAVTGAFLSFDVILFYGFFELTLIPAFFLIGQWGVGSGRRDAARKFFLYTFLGSLLTLTGIIGVVLTNPTPLDVNGQVRSVVPPTASRVTDVPKAGPVTFSIPRLMQNTQVWGIVRDVRAHNSGVELQVLTRDQAEAQSRADANPDDPTLRANAETLARRVADQAEDARTTLEEAQSRRRVQTVLFFLIMCGFAVKTPIVPLHTWLPTAYMEAPLPVTMLLSSLLAKLGTFGILRIVLPLVPGPAAEFGLPVFGVLGAVSIVYGAFCAFAQRDLKRIIAYSSISHLGIVVIALFAGTAEAVGGAALHMVNHGLSTGLLLVLLGFLHDRYRSTDGTVYSGLFARFPAYGVLFMAAALASVGVPAFNNFVSEMMILAGLFRFEVTAIFGYFYAVAASSGIFLGAWYTLTMVRRVFFGPAREPVTATPVRTTLTAAEGAGFGLPLVLILALGVCPQPAVDAIAADAVTMEKQATEARCRALMQPYPDRSRPGPGDAPRLVPIEIRPNR